MLVLSVGVQERVVIAPGTPHEVTVWFTKVKGGGQIQLGFESRNPVEILRGALIDRKRRASDRIADLADVIDLGGES